MSLSPAQIAALADHEAVPLGYPRHVEAWLSVHTQGRIDAAGFAVELTVEPLQYAYPWVSYRRDGALLEVGEQRWRLTPQQLAVFETYDRVRDAGSSVEERLRAWPAFVAALHVGTGGHVRLEGQLPRVLLRDVATLPPTSLTRADGQLCPVEATPNARWSMTHGHRYYLRTA